MTCASVLLVALTFEFDFMDCGVQDMSIAIYGFSSFSTMDENRKVFHRRHYKPSSEGRSRLNPAQLIQARVASFHVSYCEIY